MALQVLDTLEYLHNLEPPVIYRDLKPSNVMLTPSEPGQADRFRNRALVPAAQQRDDDRHAGLRAARAISRQGRSSAPTCTRSAPRCIMRCRAAIRRSSRRSVFRRCARCALTLRPRSCELIDQALKYDVVLRVADAAEFRQRLMAIKSGAPIAAPQRNSATRGRRVRSSSCRSAGHPGGSVRAPTMLSNAIDTAVSAMRPEHPGGFELLLVLRGRRDGTICRRRIAARRHEAQTIVLDDVAAPANFPGPIFHEHRRRRRRPAADDGVRGRRMFFARVLDLSFVSSAAVRRRQRPVSRVRFLPRLRTERRAGRAAEPAHTEPRVIALRRALDMQGYNSVHFKMDGDTIMLVGRGAD